jgi:hypothetical protein
MGTINNADTEADMSKETLDTFNERAYIDEFGAVRWKSNDRIPFDDKLAEFAALGIEFNKNECIVSRDIEQREALKAYAEAQANRTPEQIAEQRAEARAAMGPGVKMVNVLTGERYTT